VLSLYRQSIARFFSSKGPELGTTGEDPFLTRSTRGLYSIFSEL